MSKCVNCGYELPAGANNCPNCGAPTNVGAPAPNPTDHTAEFDSKDISDNKVMAMLPYLLSCFGILIAVIAAKDSPFTGFHVKQALKITVLEALLAIAAVVLCWTFIVPAAAIVCCAILLVLSVIGFVNVCCGKAKELPIISKFKFLK